MRRRTFYGVVGLMVCSLWAVPALAADVDVYGEGVYTGTELIVDVYADINTGELKSFGVKLAYNPARLLVTASSKNESIWYLGDGTTNYSYLAPQTATAGEVVIIGGILNTTSPLSGVTGTRRLLGSVHFSRLDAGTDFGFGLGLGKGGTYANFVTIPAGGGVAEVLDGHGEKLSFLGVETNAACALTGDFDGDNDVDINDYNTFKQNWGWSGAAGSGHTADFDNDGDVDINDYNTFKQNWGKSCR